MEKSARSRLLWTLARIGVTLAAFALLFASTDVAKVGETLRTFPLSAAATTIAIAYVAIGIGAVRWRVLMHTCGATSTPPLSRLYALTLVGMFYSTVLPGAVAGDVIRGLATARNFEGKGVTSALAVALLERLSGLAGLVTVAAVAFWANPLVGVEGLRLWGAVGLVLALVGTTTAAFGARLARFLPSTVAALARKLPHVERPAGLLLALVLSFGSQLAVILAGHNLVSAVAPTVQLGDSAVVMPVVSVASYFPLTVAGAGARELAMVAVYGVVGVSEERALVAALAFFGCSLFVAATGGLLNLLRPLDK